MLKAFQKNGGTVFGPIVPYLTHLTSRSHHGTKYSKYLCILSLYAPAVNMTAATPFDSNIWNKCMGVVFFCGTPKMGAVLFHVLILPFKTTKIVVPSK